MNYYENALTFEGTPYKYGGMDKNGIDCSGLVNAATGQKSRVWSTSMGKPCGDWIEISYDSLLRQGDLFLWKGHCAFYAGDGRMFHARREGTRVGFTNDLRTYYLKEKGFPRVFRQIENI